MEFESMRVFKDGNQLVIVLDNAGEAMEKMVMGLINGEIPQATHLSPPAPISKKRPDISSMKEVTPAKPAKFIQESQKSSDMRTVRLEEDPEEKAKEEREKNMDAQPSKEEGVKQNPNFAAEKSEEGSIKEAPLKDPKFMNYFELRDFLESNRDNTDLKELLMTRYYTDDLMFVINTKGERELRELVEKIM